MKINSKNAFSNIFSKEERLNLLEKKLLNREKKILDKQSKDKKNLIPEKFFTLGYKQGYEQGIKEGAKKGVQSLGIEPRAEGGPVTKGKPYLVGEEGKETYVPFAGSIERKDGFLKKKSFFGDKRETEISSLDGSDYFKTMTDLSGGLNTKTIQRKNITETDEYGGVTNLSIDKEYTEKATSIGVPDLIEHQDQLLGEINKLKGFENVTIDQVINQTTGIPQEKLLPILMRSDAQKATSQKQEEARKLDLESRGIKPGQGFSMSADDEIGQSLAGTSGYRMGQINPDMLVSSIENFKEKSVQTYNSEGVQPSKEENNQFASLARDINQSVNKTRVKTVIQPVIQTQIQQVPTPVPMSSPSTQITQISKSKLPPSIAKMIN